MAIRRRTAESDVRALAEYEVRRARQLRKEHANEQHLDALVPGCPGCDLIAGPTNVLRTETFAGVAGAFDELSDDTTES